MVKLIGDGYHINWLSSERLYLLEIDADQWKSWVHARLSTPAGGRGALSLFEASPQEHLALAKHLTAERKVEEFVAGKGTVTRWERIRRQNHWFDCLYLASAAAHLCGIRLIDEPPRVVDDRPRVTGGIRREDGRPWVDLSRWHPVWERERD